MLLTLGLALAGAGAFFLLPSRRCPISTFPPISVTAPLPGAARNHGHQCGNPAGAPSRHHRRRTEMTSSSSVGSTRITLQFDLDRDIDGAARDVQAAINAAHVDLPADSNRSHLPQGQPCRFPVLILALTSNVSTRGQIYDSASTVMQQKLSQVSGVGEVDRRRRLPAGGAGRTQSAGAVQIRHRARRRGARCPRQCQFAQGRHPAG